MNRGSEWRIWDLHFHTPSSYDYKDKSVTNEDIVKGSQGIREHVCDILEGGRDAFEKREQKYGFR